MSIKKLVPESAQTLRGIFGRIGDALSALLEDDQAGCADLNAAEMSENIEPWVKESFSHCVRMRFGARPPMSFDVGADSYDRFIGRYSRELAPLFATFAGVTEGPVLDVGCGPGALTAELATQMGAANVAGVDLSERFVAACRTRVPGADVRLASAEALPFVDGTFACALSQLVVSFVNNADRMASEMRRVVRRGGTVALCTFEENGFALVRAFWDAALHFDPDAPDDAHLPFRRPGELVGLCERAGLGEVVSEELSVEAAYADFGDLWTPFSFGIGPAAGYLQAQTPERRAAIRDYCFDLLGRPEAGFTLAAKVVAARGRVEPSLDGM